ncbi:heavy metal sensor histidine kinase [Pseudomonas sp. ZS1P83]
MSWKRATDALDPRCWSLTARLAFFFTLATAAILIGVSGLLYSELKLQLRAKDKIELHQAAIALSESVRELASEEQRENWRREWEESVSRSPRLSARVLKPDGGVYIATPGMLPPSPAFPAIASPPAYGRWRTAEDDEHYLLTTVPVETPSGQFWRVEAALDLTHSHEVLEAYVRRLAWLLLIATILTSMVGRLIAQRGLRPLLLIGTQMHRISGEKLSHRIGRQSWPRELAELAESFDAMLGRLEDAFAQLNRFSADLAHEVRTPVNNLVAAASVTLARPRTPEEYQDALATVIEECEHLAHMVEAMLFLARAENAVEVLHVETLSVANEFQRQVEIFDALAADKRVILSRKGEASIQADPILLRRALSNLIANAIRHSPEGGKVWLMAREDHEFVRLTVQDSGLGIPPECLPHLFERFYRIDSSRSGWHGTGLGLSIVQSVAQLHGGQVTVSSSPGKGATFSLLLPKAGKL